VPILHAIVLGIVQGLAEFIPISSSGHLVFVPWLFGWDDFAGNESLQKTFDVALHIGTLAGAIAYFRNDLLSLARAALLPGRQHVRVPATPEEPAGPEGDQPGAVIRSAENERRLAWMLVASAIPAALTGAVLADTIEENTDQIWLIAVMLIVFGGVLLWADRLVGDRPTDDFRLRDALLMGAGQALALQPGISRSGVTITVGRRIGFSRDAAARLSFLMSLPIIGGAIVFKGIDVFSEGGIPADMRAAFAAGIIASGITGWIAVWGTLKLIQTRTFAPFVVYRVIVGAGLLLVLATGLR
jgi:undecaprenyl-diphosphatase